jgi:site-specific recombinase XerD
LKVGTRRGLLNAFRLDLSAHAPDLIPHLEAYLARFRPLLPHADADPHLWLTRGGRPYTAHSVHAELRAAVDRRLGRHFYPHLIRTIWATEFINATGDFTTAAYMLNDRVETVLRRYQALLDRDLQAKARAFLRQALPPAPGGRSV